MLDSTAVRTFDKKVAPFVDIVNMGGIIADRCGQALLQRIQQIIRDLPGNFRVFVVDADLHKGIALVRDLHQLVDIGEVRVRIHDPPDVFQQLRVKGVEPGISLRDAVLLIDGQPRRIRIDRRVRLHIQRHAGNPAVQRIHGVIQAVVHILLLSLYLKPGESHIGLRGRDVHLEQLFQGVFGLVDVVVCIDQRGLGVSQILLADSRAGVDGSVDAK